MSPLDLLFLYVIIGIACGIAVAVRGEHATQTAQAVSAIVSIAIWPIWAPLALSQERFRPAAPQAECPQIEAALHEAVSAAEDTPLAALLPVGAAQRIVAEVRRVEARCQELGVLLSRPDFDLSRAERRVQQLHEQESPARVVATARLQLENAERLHRLLASDRRALSELADLIGALRTQFVLARYAGSSIEGVGGIVSEVWSRVEGLGEAMEIQECRLDDFNPPADPAPSTQPSTHPATSANPANPELCPTGTS